MRDVLLSVLLSLLATFQVRGLPNSTRLNRWQAILFLLLHATPGD
jgi:hypothetical protein